MVHKDKDTRLSRTSTALHVTPDKWFNFYLDSVSLSPKTDEKLLNLCDFFGDKKKKKSCNKNQGWQIFLLRVQNKNHKLKDL